METGKRKLLGVTPSEPREVVQALGIPLFAGGQMIKWLYQRQVTSIGEMIDISKSNRKRLAEEYEIGCVAHIGVRYSKDGTIKHLFSAASGRFVEAVFIPDDDRAILRVSCQVGCKMNCLFCQTGKQGFEGNLAYADILDQVYSLSERDRLTNTMFMGQGELVDNLDNVPKVTQVVIADHGYVWSPKRITMSSVGVRGKLKRSLDESDYRVAISLHPALPEQHSMLMPAEKGMSVEQIVGLLRGYDFARQRWLSFEYIAFDGLGDTSMHAHKIIDLLHGLDYRISLVRFRQIPSVPLKGADEQKMESSRNYLTLYGAFTTIRASRGQDIFVAYGLLSTAKKADA